MTTGYLEGLKNKLSILMVDDHEENLLALESILDDSIFRFVKATSGRDALRHVLREDFALILLDVRMPDIDGFETARLIRDRERSRHTPIIFLTAYASEDEQVFLGYASGAVDYISKPFVPEILTSKVRIFAELYQKTQDLKRMNERLEELVTERTQELRRAEANYRSIFEHAMEGIFQSTQNGRFRTANPAFARILGYDSPEELIKEVTNIGEQVYVSREHYGEYRRLLEQNGSVAGFASQVRRRDGSIIWISENTRLLRNSAGMPDGFEGLVEDITQRRLAEDITKARTRDLESLLHVISHDLREPLRAVRGYTEIVIEDCGPSLTQDGRQLLDRVVTAAGRLSTLLDNIQTLIYAQQLGPPTEEADFNDIVSEVLTLLEQRIAETHSNILIEGELPKLRADRAWARQAIYNLLSNALKFVKPNTSPDIEIAAYPGNGSRPTGIVVRDRGPGVPPEHAQRIFELFRREVGREVDGTGAGLAIVHQVAERHGGRAWVQPRQGGGSEFIITFGA